MIRDLAVSYVSQKECLILLTITMRGEFRSFLKFCSNCLLDDIDNQAACLIAREFDPLGTRTIGIALHIPTLICRCTYQGRYRSDR